MNLIGTYESASGPSIDDCAFLGLRYDQDEGFHPDESECWILCAKRATSGPQPYDFRYQGGTISWYTAIWRAPSGTVYISDMSGQLHTHPDLWAEDAREHWGEHQLGVPLSGLWGIDDRCVLAWGGTSQRGFKVFGWEGTRWTEMPSPRMDVRSMHGLAPDHVYAVGIGGRIARWDGSAWSDVASPTAEDLKSVFVASEDEVYAVGAGGSVLEGSSSGLDVIAVAPLAQVGMPLYAVAKWKGQLWIGGGPQGLFRRVGTTGELELFKPKVKATSFDVREQLVIAGDTHVVGSADGEKFTGIGRDVLTEARAGKRLGDLG